MCRTKGNLLADFLVRIRDGILDTLSRTFLVVVGGGDVWVVVWAVGVQGV